MLVLLAESNFCRMGLGSMHPHALLDSWPQTIPPSYVSVLSRDFILLSIDTLPAELCSVFLVASFFSIIIYVFIGTCYLGFDFEHLDAE